MSTSCQLTWWMKPCSLSSIFWFCSTHCKPGSQVSLTMRQYKTKRMDDVRLCITPSAHIPAHSPCLQVVAKVKVLLPFFSFLHQTINDNCTYLSFSLSKLTCYTNRKVTSGNTEPQRVFLRRSNPAIIRGHCSYHRVQIKCLRMSYSGGGSVNQMNLYCPTPTVYDAA